MTNEILPVPFSFQVSFGGKDEDDTTDFSEVSGINIELTEAEVVSGGENHFQHHIPGIAKHQNLILKRGSVASSSALLTWVKQTLEGGLNTPIVPKDITIALLDSESKVWMNWNFIDAYPVKCNIADAKNNMISIESIEFAYKIIHRSA